MATLRLEEHSIEEEFHKEKPEKQESKVVIKDMDNINMEVDFIGFHFSLINAYRRIILAEVPTMAIEKVYMYNNTSIVQDEVLAHRLGLVPLNAGPSFFEYKTLGESEWGTQDSLKYELKVKCSKNKTTNDVLDRTIYSSHLKWQPIGDQKDIFAATPCEPLHDDIILAKMNPGHEINLEAYAVKGIGSDHAKFQPGMAWYRMLPQIQLTTEIEGEKAERLQKYFSPGVIELETKKNGKTVAKVADARNDSCSRNVFSDAELKNCVKLTRKTDHLIFYVESHSALKSHEILENAIDILNLKCDTLLTELEKYMDEL